MKIITNENCVIIDDVAYPSNQYKAIARFDGVGLRSVEGNDYLRVLVEGTTIDGAPVSDADTLFNYFLTNSFSKGGGDGSGVTWDEVQDKPIKTLAIPLSESEGLIPSYTQEGQLPVGMPEFPENAVPLALLDIRMAPVINNELTSEETSVSLQALYPSVAIGTKIISTTVGVEYQKISNAQWSKSSLTII